MFNFLWINFNWIQTNKQTPSYLQFPEPSKLVQKIQFYSCEGLEREDFPGVWIYHNYCIWKKTWNFRNQWLHSVRSYWKDLTWLLHYVCIKTTVYVLALFNLGHITSSRAQICHFTHTSLLNYLYVTIFIYLSLQIMQFL